nr:hypothetical protein Iba_chr12dCG1480 [Ipomoea batatas]
MEVSIFGGPEWRLDKACEGGYESRFFTEPMDPFSGVQFSTAKGLCVARDGELAKLSSSLTDDPPMLCLLLRSDWTLNTLLASSSWLATLTLGLGGFGFFEEGCLVVIAGEWWFEGRARLGFWLVGEEGFLSSRSAVPLGDLEDFFQVCCQDKILKVNKPNIDSDGQREGSVPSSSRALLHVSAEAASAELDFPPTSYFFSNESEILLPSTCLKTLRVQLIEQPLQQPRLLLPWICPKTLQLQLIEQLLQRPQ